MSFVFLVVLSVERFHSNPICPSCFLKMLRMLWFNTSRCILAHNWFKKSVNFCGRITRKDFECKISICGRILRKDFVEGCGRIQKNNWFFCWPIFAEGSLRKDSAEGFSMRNRHLWKDSAEGFCGRISEGSAKGSSQKEENLSMR